MSEGSSPQRGRPGASVKNVGGLRRARAPALCSKATRSASAHSNSLPMSRLAYFQTCLRKSLRGDGRACPSCGSSDATVTQRKAAITALRRCNRCELLFRTPTTTPEESAAFYQSDYSQGFTTTLPTATELAALKARRFAGSDKCYDDYARLLADLHPTKGARLFDFGCSWGYGSWQLAEHGWQVDAYEISKPRAQFAIDHMGVSFIPPDCASPESYDVFFSAHVIEHVPSVRSMIETGWSLLKPGGWWVAFTPNGATARRERAPRAWSRNWGSVHPQFLDERFLQKAFPSECGLILSEPYPNPLPHLPSSQTWLIGSLTGSELMVAVKKNA